MTYQEVLANARTCMGPHCKSCPTCNGLGCRNAIPGPGAKGVGTGFIRNYQKWQELCVNMDTICEKVRYFQNTYGPESIVCFGGTGREACIFYYALTFSVLQSPNCCYTQSGWSCYFSLP